MLNCFWYTNSALSALFVDPSTALSQRKPFLESDHDAANLFGNLLTGRQEVTADGAAALGFSPTSHSRVLQPPS